MICKPNYKFWPVVALVTISVLYVYRIQIGGISFPPFRLAYLPIGAIFLVPFILGKFPINRRHIVLFVIMSGILLVLGFDLLRMDNIGRFGRNMFNHVLFLSLVVVIVFYCNNIDGIRAIQVGCMVGSVLSILISSYWLQVGELPFSMFVTNFAGSDISLNVTQFTVTGIPRLSGAFFDPNFYGLFLVCVCGMAINGILYRKWKFLFVILLVGNVVALMLTMSRTSFVGLAVVFAVSLGFVRHLKIFSIIFIGTFSLVYLVFVISGLDVQDLPILTRFTEVSDRAGRLPYHMAGVEAFSAHPLFGCGNDGLLQYVNQYSFSVNSSAHLVYLSWLAKYGIVGAGFYFVFLMTPLVYALSNKKLVPEIKHLVLVTYLPILTMYFAYDYFASLEIQYFIFGIGYSVFINQIGLKPKEEYFGVL